MSAPPSTVPGPVHLRRCARHPAREAAARCPVCGGFFCRECVVEHAGRVLCADCLAKEAAGTPARRRRWRALRGALEIGAAVLVAWGAFYAAGTLLLKIPANFHEGTIWKSPGVAEP